MTVLRRSYNADVLRGRGAIGGSGRIVRVENFSSKYVPSRNVDIWLPDNYTPTKKYAVLYMHDGQMLFDSSITWNKQEWGVDETVTKLIQQQKIRECIVVGIWNGGKSRHPEYFPQKPFESLSKENQKLVYDAYRSGGQSIFSGLAISSDNYLKFLTVLQVASDPWFLTPLKASKKHLFVLWINF